MTKTTGRTEQYVLLVEDDPDVREALEMTLEAEGFQVRAVEHGAEALEVLSERALPDVILLDLMLPQMNGWDLVEVLKMDPVLAELPIVVLTAHADARIPEADAFLVKPVSTEQLAATLREHAD